MKWTQEKFSEWHEKTFSERTIHGVLRHLESEINELFESSYTEEGHVEAADCMLLLLAYADLRGFDLFEEADKKMEINVKRKWGPMNDKGFVEHIKDDV